MIDGIRRAYEPFARAAGSRQPTDTLVTKVVLGTFGCLPAWDRYFIDGFKSKKLKYSRVNDILIKRLRGFCQANLTDLRTEQLDIEPAQRGALSPDEAR